jgi:hypothetical protein
MSFFVQGRIVRQMEKVAASKNISKVPSLKGNGKRETINLLFCRREIT